MITLLRYGIKMDKPKLLYTNFLTKDAIGVRNIDEHPGDKEYEELALKEPTYEMISVYIASEVDNFLQEQEKKMKQAFELGLNNGSEDNFKGLFGETNE